MLISIVARASSLPLLVPTITQQMMRGGDGGWGWGAWIFMSLMMVVFWGGVLAVIVWLVRSNSHSASASPSAPMTPLAIAAERYARGEISDEEFARIKRGLS